MRWRRPIPDGDGQRVAGRSPSIDGGRGPRNERGNEAEGLVTEAAAFLRGELLPALREVPAWVPVSRLAHAEVTTLTARTAPAVAAHPSGWEAATSYLTAELLALAPTPDELRRVQHEALIPLELDLLEGVIAAPASTAELVELVLATLHRYQVFGAR